MTEMFKKGYSDYLAGYPVEAGRGLVDPTERADWLRGYHASIIEEQEYLEECWKGLAIFNVSSRQV